MSQMTPFTIALTPMQFAAAKDRLRESTGINLIANTGEISHDWAKVKYSFDGSSTLTITPEKWPPLVDEAYAEKQVIAWLAGS